MIPSGTQALDRHSLAHRHHWDGQAAAQIQQYWQFDVQSLTLEFDIGLFNLPGQHGQINFTPCLSNFKPNLPGLTQKPLSVFVEIKIKNDSVTETIVKN